VGVEVVVRQATPQARRRIEASLEEQGVPLRELSLREDRSQLQHPIPLRGDLREQTFSPRLSRNLAPGDEADLLHPSLQESLAGES